MKKYFLLLPFVTLLLFQGILHADEEKRKYPPEGMEIKKVGDVEFLVPMGARIRREGGLNVVESISEFSSRKFLQIQNQFENIETKHDALANEIKDDLNRLHSKQEEIEKALIQIKEDMLEFKRYLADIQKQSNNIETMRNNLENKTKQNIKYLQVKQEDIEKTLIHIMNNILEIKEVINKENIDQKNSDADG